MRAGRPLRGRLVRTSGQPHESGLLRIRGAGTVAPARRALRGRARSTRTHSPHARLPLAGRARLRRGRRAAAGGGLGRNRPQHAHRRAGRLARGAALGATRGLDRRPSPRPRRSLRDGVAPLPHGDTVHGPLPVRRGRRPVSPHRRTAARITGPVDGNVSRRGRAHASHRPSPGRSRRRLAPALRPPAALGSAHDGGGARGPGRALDPGGGRLAGPQPARRRRSRGQRRAREVRLPEPRIGHHRPAPGRVHRSRACPAHALHRGRGEADRGPPGATLRSCRPGARGAASHPVPEDASALAAGAAPGNGRRGRVAGLRSRRVAPSGRTGVGRARGRGGGPAPAPAVRGGGVGPLDDEARIPDWPSGRGAPGGARALLRDPVHGTAGLLAVPRALHAAPGPVRRARLDRHLTRRRAILPPASAPAGGACDNRRWRWPLRTRAGSSPSRRASTRDG